MTPLDTPKKTVIVLVRTPLTLRKLYKTAIFITLVAPSAAPFLVAFLGLTYRSLPLT